MNARENRDGKPFIGAVRLDRGTDFVSWPATTQFACLIVLGTILSSPIRLRCFLPFQGIRLQWESEERVSCYPCPRMTLHTDRLFDCASAIFAHALEKEPVTISPNPNFISFVCTYSLPQHAIVRQ